MRETLNSLLTKQHELGLRRTDAAREEYVRVSIEILNLARSGVDLMPNWKPDIPPRARPNIETIDDLKKAKIRLAQLDGAQWPGSLDEYRDLACQIRAVEGGILERARKRGKVA